MLDLLVTSLLPESTFFSWWLPGREIGLRVGSKAAGRPRAAATACASPSGVFEVSKSMWFVLLLVSCSSIPLSRKIRV